MANTRKQSNRLESFFKNGGLRVLWNRLLIKLIVLFNPSRSPELEQKLNFLYRMDYWPNLKHPRSFNEKVLYRMIKQPLHPLASMVSDKLAVRQYVKSKGLDEILVPLLWTGEDPDAIPFDTLPEKYVVKANHGSGWTIIVDEEHPADRRQIVQTAKAWLSQKYSHNMNERQYEQITPAIVIEQLIEDANYGLPLDYKFLCFHGRVERINVDVDRFGEHHRVCFDRDWNEMPYIYKFARGEEVIPKPVHLNRLIDIAECLSADFDFCRVDLYCPNDTDIYFSEITLTPGGAITRFYPRKWDFEIGKLWHLQSKEG